MHFIYTVLSLELIYNDFQIHMSLVLLHESRIVKLSIVNGESERCMFLVVA